MKNIAVFVSGNGSNFQSLIDACKQNKINGKIKICIASNCGAYSLQRAEENGIATKVFCKNDYANLEQMYEEIIKVLHEQSIDLIVLAGYMTILSKNIVSAFANKIINIHPSLIPNYCGKGYFGLNVHKAVLQGKEKISGATVHFVDEGTDTGAIIMQKSVEVLSNDTPEVLQQRVLQVEHQILPQAVALFCDDKLVIENGKVKIN